MAAHMRNHGERGSSKWFKEWKLIAAKNITMVSRTSKTAHSPLLKLLQNHWLRLEWQASQVEQVSTTSSLQKWNHQFKTQDVTIFTDTAWNEERKIAGLGINIIDSKTPSNRVFSQVKTNVASPVQAEGLAILEAIHRAAVLDYPKVQIASDSKECVEAILSSEHRVLHGIICDIHHFSNQFESILFTSIPRTLNHRADTLAKKSLADFVVVEELSSVP